MRRAIGLFELLDKYDTEKKRRRLLEQLRWPNGIACPRCGSVTVNRVESRNALDCYDCRYVFYVTSGTAMHGTHLPMHKWFDIDTLLNTKLNKMYIEDIQSMGYLILGWENVYRYFDAMLNFKGHRPRRPGQMCPLLGVGEPGRGIQAFQKPKVQHGATPF